MSDPVKDDAWIQDVQERKIGRKDEPMLISHSAGRRHRKSARSHGDEVMLSVDQDHESEHIESANEKRIRRDLTANTKQTSHDGLSSRMSMVAEVMELPSVRIDNQICCSSRRLNRDVMLLW